LVGWPVLNDEKEIFQMGQMQGERWKNSFTSHLSFSTHVFELLIENRNLSGPEWLRTADADPIGQGR
jgi:hypothetical protein